MSKLNNDFRPLHGRHAIASATFVLILNRPLVPEEVASIIAGHDEWRDRMPGLSRSHTVSFPIQSGGGATQISLSPSGPPNGAQFRRAAPDGSIEWQMRVEGNAIAVVCADYSNWEGVFTEVKRVLEAVFRTVATTNNDLRASACVLEYTDRFIWEGLEEKYETQSLLNPQSESLPRSVLDKGAEWHAHTGWFTRIDGVVSGRRLDNINIDAIKDSDLGPTVNIVISMTHTFEVPMGSAAKIFGKTSQKRPAALEVCFNQMHDENKRLMVSLLQPKIAEKIGLL